MQRSPNNDTGEAQETGHESRTTRSLAETNTRYSNGDTTALDDIAGKFQTLIDFYPRHIEKEDTVFFPASRTYIAYEEDQAMLAEFLEFDRKMIHEKYKSLIEEFERRR